MLNEISSTHPIVFTIIWQSSLFIMAGLIASYVYKRHPARAHLMLFLSMIAAVAVPFMTIAVKHLDLGLFLGEPEPAVEYVMTSEVKLQPYENPLSDVAAQVPVASEKPGLNWRQILLAGWASASMIFLARLILTFILGIRLVKRSQHFQYPKVSESIQAAASKLGIKENVIVNNSKSVSSPVIWCWKQNPILLLPLDKRLLNDKIDLVGIFCHELAHLMRRDHVAGLLSEFIVVFLPFHPLVWWAKKRLLTLSEHACDDWVIAGGGCGMNYAESLLELVKAKQMAFVPAVVRNKKVLKGRVMRMLKESHGNPRLSKKWILSAVLITSCITLTVAFAQTRSARPDVAGSTPRQEFSGETNEPMPAANYNDAAEIQGATSALNQVEDLVRIDATICEVGENLWKDISESMNVVDGTDNQFIIIDDNHVKSLIQSVTEDEDSEILQTPSLATFENKATEIFVGNELPIVTGYNEPNSRSEKAIPVYEFREVGLKLRINPRVTNDKSEIEISGSVEYSRVTGSEERIFNDKYTATVPLIHKGDDLLSNIIPIGKTLLIYSISMPQIDTQSNLYDKENKILFFIKPNISSLNILEGSSSSGQTGDEADLASLKSQYASETGLGRDPEISDFEFVMGVRGAGTSFESHHGTHWLQLTWGTTAGGESEFWLDNSGVAPRESSLLGQGFLIHVTVSGGQVHMESKRGTAWKEVSFDATHPDWQSAVVDELGVRSLLFSQQ